MNKKGLLYNLTLTIVVISLLSYALFKFYVKYNQFEPIGKKQLNLFTTYQKAESALFYIDQSAKYALQQAVYDLAQRGGYSEIEVEEPPAFDYMYNSPSYGKCGRFYGYSIWQLENQNDCFDVNKIKSSLLNLFNKKLDQYTENYLFNIPSNNYNYEIKDSIEIVGKPVKPLVLYIAKDESRPVFREPEKTIIPKIGNMVDFTGKTKKELLPDEKLPVCRNGKRCVLSSEAYELLKKAQEKAIEKGTWIEVTDGYRTVDDLIALWEGRTPENFKLAIPDESLRRKYVCYPYGNDVEQRCSHLSGDAVDVFLEGKTKKTMTIDDYRLLYSLMTSVGWVRYTKEPWHFECCGTKRFEVAKAKGVAEVGEV